MRVIFAVFFFFSVIVQLQAISLKIQVEGNFSQEELPFVLEFQKGFESEFLKNAENIFFSAPDLPIRFLVKTDKQNFSISAFLQENPFYFEGNIFLKDPLSLSRAITQTVENLLLYLFLQGSFLMEKRISLFPVLYEYPAFSQDGKFFLYITEKKTGNSNPFVTILASGENILFPLPLKSEFFPQISQNSLFYLQSQEKARDLKKTLVTKAPAIETSVASGEFTCLRIVGSDYYLSEENRIRKITPDKMYEKTFDSFGFEIIQSFDISAQFWVLSVRREVAQYDLFLYEPAKDFGFFLTRTPYNEVDVKFSADGTRIVFSSNPDNYFNVFYFDLQAGLLKRITKNQYDDYYPTFSPQGNGIIFCRYESRMEPYLVAIPLR